MGEAILIKALSGGGGSSGAKQYYTYQNDGIFVAPADGNYQITCIGGGGGGVGDYNKCDGIGFNNYSGTFYMLLPYGGSSGSWNTKTVFLNGGRSYNISIGGAGNFDGPFSYTNGGTTSFDSLISASGGITVSNNLQYANFGSLSGIISSRFGGNMPNTHFFAVVNTSNKNINTSNSWTLNTSKSQYTAEIGCGGVLYINGTNVKNTPTSGYYASPFGRGGNSYHGNMNGSSLTNDTIKKIYTILDLIIAIMCINRLKVVGLGLQLLSLLINIKSFCFNC